MIMTFDNHYNIDDINSDDNDNNNIIMSKVTR